MLEGNESNIGKQIFPIIRKIITVLTLVAPLFEIVIFPSWGNLTGCLMMCVSYFILMYLFRSGRYILNYPFAFFVMLSACMYRFLPIPSTLIEGHPISYGMEMPIKTFLLETLLLIITFCAFWLASRGCFHNNSIQKLFNSVGLYKIVKDRTLWIIGSIALFAQFLMLIMGFSSYAAILYRVLAGFVGFMCAPVLIMFPCLYKKEFDKPVDFNHPMVWMFIGLSAVVNLATNSRVNILYPFATIALFYLIYLCKMSVNIKKLLNPKKIILPVILIFISLYVLQGISHAMLAVRSIRSDIDYLQLIELTIDQMANGNSNIIEDENDEVTKYSQGWTEDYIGNFMLNRYANMRITDETLYFADHFSENAKKQMLEDLSRRLLMLLPTPALKIIGVNIDKTEYEYSRGDAIYYYSGYGTKYCLGGYRVTSHIADGLVTFGWSYFVIQFITFIVLFRFLKWLSFFRKDGTIVYSIFGLVSIFDIFGLFRNSSGIYNEWSYILRDYWQGIILILIIEALGNFISRLKIGGK